MLVWCNSVASRGLQIQSMIIKKHGTNKSISRNLSSTPLMWYGKKTVKQDLPWRFMMTCTPGTRNAIIYSSTEKGCAAHRHPQPLKVYIKRDHSIYVVPSTSKAVNPSWSGFSAEVLSQMDHLECAHRVSTKVTNENNDLCFYCGFLKNTADGGLGTSVGG